MKMRALWKSKKYPVTSQIHLSSNDAPRQWNLNIISTKVTTGNAPNKLKVINNMVEDAYAISEENSDEQGTINKINVLPSRLGNRSIAGSYMYRSWQL